MKLYMTKKISKKKKKTFPQEIVEMVQKIGFLYYTEKFGPCFFLK